MITVGAGIVSSRPSLGTRRIVSSVPSAAYLRNYWNRSNEFSHALWTKSDVTMTANFATDPFGGNNAWRMAGGVSAAVRHNINRPAQGSPFEELCTASVYMKLNDAAWPWVVLTTSAQHAFNGISTVSDSYFNLTTGLWGNISANHTVVASVIGSGWYRLSVAFRPTVTSSPNNRPAVFFGMASANGTNAFNGSGASVQIYGSQWEPWQGAFTAYQDQGANLTVEAPLLVCDGDSLTAGQQASGGSADAGNGLLAYPSLLYSSLAGRISGVYNAGLGGQRADAFDDDASTQIDPLYSTGAILIIWIGCNDIANAETAASTWTEIQAYVTGRRSAGYTKVIGCTILPRTGIDAGAEETARLALNTSILAGLGSVFERVVDLTTDSRLTNTANATYFVADGVHLTPAGYAVVASLIEPKVVELLAA